MANTPDPKKFELFTQEALALAERAHEIEQSVSALKITANRLREQAQQKRAHAALYAPTDLEDERERSCTGKRRYKTLEGAGDAAKGIKEKRDVDLRIYPCRFCGGFHFTSSSLEQFAGVEAA